ncbi:TonB-dependent receptor [Roseateles sp.]|uniref:TonB-dependent receptor n=1 Tax=Roseateles sp. TaxID=1971397 RepID=UPI003D11F1F0
MRDLARGLFAVSSIAFAVSAMAAEEQTETSKTGESAVQLEQVVVQARRREERLSDVPASVSAMSAAALKSAGVSSVAGLTQYIPGLNVAEGVDNNTARFFIRGMGTATPAVGIEPSVPVYIDDVYTPSGLGSNINLFSVDRVEVLRGPQGTLYGRNAFGGAIKVYTKPLNDRADGYVEVATGNSNRRDVKAEMSGALVPGMLRFNLGAASLMRDGYQTLVNTGKKGWGEDTKVLKGKLQFDPTDKLRFTVAYDKTDADAPAKQLKITNSGMKDIFNTGPLAGYPKIVPNRLQSSTDPDVLDTDTFGNSTVKARGLTWSAQWQVSDDLLVKYLGADRKMENGRIFDIEGTAAPFLTVSEQLNLRGKSHELQANWSRGPLNVIGGVFYYTEDTSSRSADVNNFLAFLDTKHQASYVTDPNGRQTAVDIRRVFDGLSQQVTSKAAFVNVGYALTKDLNVTGGIRFTEDDKATQGNRPSTTFVGGSLADFSTNSCFCVPEGATIIDTTFGGQLSGQRKYRAVTPEFTVDYNYARNQMAYASFKRGFQAGSIFPASNVVPGAALSTDAQGVDALELGNKGTFLDGRLSLNASVYYNRYKDLLVSVNTAVPIAVSATGFAGVPQNAGAAHSTGIELESRYQVTRELLLTANVAYNQFKVTEVMAASPTGPVNIANTFLDVPTLSPSLQGNVRFDYRFNLNSGLAARIFANAAYRSKIGINAANASESSGLGLVGANPATDKYYISPAVTLISAGVSLNTEDQKWRIDLIGQNLNNQRRPVSTVAVVPDFFGAIQQWNEPRNWRLSVTRSF